MKILLKILFFLFAIFQTNISEAKVFVFDDVVSEIKFTVDKVESKNHSKLILKNDFGKTCKSESNLVAYRNLLLGFKATAAKKVTNAELVSQVAIRAERAIGGTGRFAGTAKHTYATTLLKRYQKIYGSRGLEVNEYFNGKFGRGFLDVHDVTNGIIYDFKFGQPFMNASQFNKYSNTFGQPINIVDRFGSIIPR